MPSVPGSAMDARSFINRPRRLVRRPCSSSSAIRFPRASFSGRRSMYSESSCTRRSRSLMRAFRFVGGCVEMAKAPCVVAFVLFSGAPILVFPPPCGAHRGGLVPCTAQALHRSPVAVSAVHFLLTISSLCCAEGRFHLFLRLDVVGSYACSVAWSGLFCKDSDGAVSAASFLPGRRSLRRVVLSFGFALCRGSLGRVCVSQSAPAPTICVLDSGADLTATCISSCVLGPGAALPPRGLWPRLCSLCFCLARAQLMPRSARLFFFRGGQFVAGGSWNRTRRVSVALAAGPIPKSPKALADERRSLCAWVVGVDGSLCCL